MTCGHLKEQFKQNKRAGLGPALFKKDYSFQNKIQI